MSIKTFIHSIIGDNKHPALANAPATTVAAVKAFSHSETSKVVAALVATDIGAAVKADILAVKDHSLSGSQKFEKVVANTVPLLLKYATGGGIAAVEADVISIARALVQVVYTDTASTGFGKIAGELLKLLGV
jgi:hypothetical protein